MLSLLLAMSAHAIECDVQEVLLDLELSATTGAQDVDQELARFEEALGCDVVVPEGLVHSFQAMVPDLPGLTHDPDGVGWLDVRVPDQAWVAVDGVEVSGKVALPTGVHLVQVGYGPERVAAWGGLAHTSTGALDQWDVLFLSEGEAGASGCQDVEMVLERAEALLGSDRLAEAEVRLDEAMLLEDCDPSLGERVEALRVEVAARRGEILALPPVGPPSLAENRARWISHAGLLTLGAGLGWMAAWKFGDLDEGHLLGSGVTSVAGALALSGGTLAWRAQLVRRGVPVSGGGAASSLFFGCTSVMYASPLTLGLTVSGSVFQWGMNSRAAWRAREGRQRHER